MLDRELVYVPTGLKSFLYAFVLKGKRKLVAGPNVTGIPLLMNPANPSPLMTTKMANSWIEMSEVRVKECINAGTSRSHIHLVPHSIDTEKFNPTFRERDIWCKYDLDLDALKLIYVGHLDVEQKGVPLVIQAYQQIRTQLPEVRMDLVLIGKGEKTLSEVDCNLTGVHILGPRYGQELVQLLASSDIFLAASRYETFWFAPLEAMACGIPVVVSKVGAVPDMIPENGVQGYAIPIVDTHHQYLPNAAQLLADAMLPLIKDKELRTKIGKRARAHAKEHFSEQRLGANLVEVFTKVLEG